MASDEGSGIPERGLTTGWFIAPQLVITAGFVFDQVRTKHPEAPFRIEIGGEEASVRVELLIGVPELLGYGLLPRAAQYPMLAVFRVAASNDRPLALCF